jgi:protein TonB
METIETWTFQPAMKDGKPVASEQQLLFHYERA